MRDHFLGRIPMYEDVDAVDKTIIEIVDEVLVPLCRR
jgi:hypothetical protein